MRLLYLCPEYPPADCGGIGHFYRTLARAAVAKGAEVSLIAVDPGATESARSLEEGVAILRLPGVRLAGPVVRIGRRRWDCGVVRSRWALRRAAEEEIRRERPHVVESYDWSGPAPWKPPVPYVVRMHGASAVRAALFGRRPGRLLRHCERRTVAASDALVAVSGWIGRRTVEAFGLRREFQTVPNGVDSVRFFPSSQQRKDPEILYVGSVREDKGVGLLLDIFVELGSRRPGLRLRLAGALPAAGLEAPFLARRLAALEPQLRDRIRFDGRLPQAELPGLYSRAAVCVFPSTGEAHPLACLEAMSCGAAVVANGDGGMGETLEDGRSGLLVRSAETGPWVRVMERILASSELALRLGREARRRVLRNFSLDVTVERNLALYERVAAGGGLR